MNRQNSEPMAPSSVSTLSTQVGSLLRWHSSGSFGSTAPEDRRADHFFDQIEDLLVEMMNDPTQRRLHCRFLQGQFHGEQPPTVFTAVLVVMPPLPKD